MSPTKTMQTLIVALGAGLSVWGLIKLLEAYETGDRELRTDGMQTFLDGIEIAENCHDFDFTED